MKTSFLALAFVAPLGLGLLAPRDASACGACVVPPQVNTIVTSHRMALSVSPKQTVLWDQIRYSGDPESWGWILPVKPGAVVELSTDAWFETLDAATSATVYPPPTNCGGGSGPSCGCGSALSDAGGFEGSSGGGVTVVHRGTVGPFETVTLSTETPGVLDDWLTKAGFAIPAGSSSVIDAYIAEGFDFIALKLLPNKGVDEMKPVRVVSPGANPTLPLRMVAIGTGASVGITLFVISEGRFAAKNFGNTQVPSGLLSWDFATGSSNYSTLRTSALADNGGATWATTFAIPNALLNQLPSDFTGSRFYTVDPVNFTSVGTIAEAYVKQGVNNNEATDQGCIASLQSLAQSTNMVVDPCPAGKPSTDPSCGTVAAGEIDARVFECGAADDITEATLDDIATALTGLHPKDVWVTRLEAELPQAALADDLVVEASATQTQVDNEMQAHTGTNVDAFCPSGVVLPPGSPAAPNGKQERDRMVVLASVMAAFVTALARRFGRAARQPARQSTGQPTPA